MPSADNFPLKYSLTCVSAAVAETVTYPLDITKTRLQLQGEQEALKNSAIRGLKTSGSRGLVKTCLGIVREEGLTRLYKGLPPAILRHIIYTGCRITFYEVLRDFFKRDKNGRYPLWKAIPTGMLSGAMGQFLASPTDLVKIRMQMEGRRLLQGLPPRYKGAWHAFRSILRSEGVLGLWKGWAPNCQRAAVVCLGDLTTYDAVKQAILKYTRLEDNTLTHALTSGCSGFVAATCSTPMDVMKTRMMNQRYSNGKGELYKSTLDCLIKTVRGEGLLALYKGFVPIWSRMGPWSVTFWVVNEEIRVLAGVGNF